MKHLLILGFSLLFTLGVVFYNFSTISISDFSTEKYQKEKPANYPFEIYTEEYFFVMTQLHNREIDKKYTSLFEKHNYSGSGYCWEDHIKQILEKENKMLLFDIYFDSDAYGFFAYTKDKKVREEFLKILCPIFQDLNLLEKYIQEADRSRIDD